MPKIGSLQITTQPFQTKQKAKERKNEAKGKRKQKAFFTHLQLYALMLS